MEWLIAGRDWLADFTNQYGWFPLYTVYLITGLTKTIRVGINLYKERSSARNNEGSVGATIKRNK